VHILPNPRVNGRWTTEPAAYEPDYLFYINYACAKTAIEKGNSTLASFALDKCARLWEMHLEGRGFHELNAKYQMEVEERRANFNDYKGPTDGDALMWSPDCHERGKPLAVPHQKGVEREQGIWRAQELDRKRMLRVCGISDCELEGPVRTEHEAASEVAGRAPDSDGLKRRGVYLPEGIAVISEKSDGSVLMGAGSAASDLGLTDSGTSTEESESSVRTPEDEARQVIETIIIGCPTQELLHTSSMAERLEKQMSELDNEDRYWID